MAIYYQLGNQLQAVQSRLAHLQLFKRLDHVAASHQLIRKGRHHHSHELIGNTRPHHRHLFLQCKISEKAAVHAIVTADRNPPSSSLGGCDSDDEHQFDPYQSESSHCSSKTAT